jgi:hypothetical protein
MAALLMPRALFGALAKQEATRLGLDAEDIVVGGGGSRLLAVELAKLMKVSRQAATIRLETLGIARPAGQAALLERQ